MNLPKVIFVSTNGAGMGHLSRCLAYARRLQDRATPVFFSLASAVDVIREMGFDADYFVSPNWSVNSTYSWNCELAVRLGMFFEQVRPSVVVFDGTWPYQGFMAACEAYGDLKLVWSRRGLLKDSARPTYADESSFDLIVNPGEFGCSFFDNRAESGGNGMMLPPVSILDDSEIFDRSEARRALGICQTKPSVLFSLGAGNINDVAGLATDLISKFESLGYQVVWVQGAIALRDMQLSSTVFRISVFPLLRYLRAFDFFVGAAGYNTCCEVAQVGIPSLLIPNENTKADDQISRAAIIASYSPVVVSSCVNEWQRGAAVSDLLKLEYRNSALAVPVNGADFAADAIYSLLSNGI